MSAKPEPVAGAPADAVYSTCTGAPRPVFWSSEGGGALWLIDQRLLPGELALSACADVESVVRAIKDMAVRGAPAIGAAGGYGVALAAARAAAKGGDGAAVAAAATAAQASLDAARPTAVNLAWATARVANAVVAAAARGGAGAAAAALVAAHALAEEDVAINRALARHGANLVPQGARILHHCNTGALATVDVGTALGVIYECAAQGKGVSVWVDETRPRLQGARLTAWELMRARIPMQLIVDGAAGGLFRAGRIDVFLFGADRVAANGDVANKVGTFSAAVLAREHGVPAYACVPTSTIDLATATGADIAIEERGADEVTQPGGPGTPHTAPAGVSVWNPAFDVTPAKYIYAIITEEGVCYPPYAQSLRRAKEAAEARIAREAAARSAAK